MHAVTNPTDHVQNLDALLILKTPAAGLNPAHVAALPLAEPWPVAAPALANKPVSKPPKKWIVTTLRALAAQQA